MHKYSVTERKFKKSDFAIRVKKDSMSHTTAMEILLL